MVDRGTKAKGFKCISAGDLQELLKLLPPLHRLDPRNPDEVMDWRDNFKKNDPNALGLLQGTSMLKAYRACGRLLMKASIHFRAMRRHTESGSTTSNDYDSNAKDMIHCLSEAGRRTELYWFQGDMYMNREVHGAIRSFLVGATTQVQPDGPLVYDCLVVVARYFFFAWHRLPAYGFDQEGQDAVTAFVKVANACIKMDDESGVNDGRMCLVKAEFLHGVCKPRDSGDFEEIIEALKRALELDEEFNYMAHFFLGRIFGRIAQGSCSHHERQNQGLSNHHYKRFVALAPDGHSELFKATISIPFGLAIEHGPDGVNTFGLEEFDSLATRFPDLPKEAHYYFKRAVAAVPVHNIFHGCSCENNLGYVLRRATTMVMLLYDLDLIDERPVNPFVCANRACETEKFCWNDLNYCSQCRCVKYCSKECQKEDWKDGGHKQECKALKARGQGTKTNTRK